VIPLIDNHGHSLLSDFRLASESDFISTFSESRFASLMTADIEHSLVFLELKKRLFDLSDATSIAEYLTLRKGSSAFARHLVKELFAKAGFERILLDDGFNTGKMVPMDQFESITGVQVSRVVRIEPVLEKLICEHSNAGAVEGHLEKRLLPARDRSIAGLKTIVCYRGGLSINEIDPEDAHANFFECRNNILATGRIRRSSYYHHLLLKAFDLAVKRDLPVQVHCGLGDDDADLSLSNPELLHRLLRKPRFSMLKLVLLHCYPFQKEAAILASLYPGVHFDLSLASFLLADQAELYRDALASAPYTKILAGTDGHSQPETYYQGAMALRQGLSTTLLSFEQKGSVSREEAGEIENAILHGNARRLYKLAH
jgi:hypothetical protein